MAESVSVFSENAFRSLSAMKPKRKLILAGGSGFLGRTLARWFAPETTEVVILTRHPHQAIPPTRTVAWNGRELGAWCGELEGATAVINLAGRSVNCRYHARNRRQMLASRIDSTTILGKAICRCKDPPSVWLNSSTATIYRHTYGDAHDEHGEIGATPEAKDAFSIEIATAWERAFREAGPLPATRQVVLRTAMVLGTEKGGVYEVLRRLVRLRLGGRMGSGRQFVSWIHAEDFCRAIAWLIDQPTSEGVYNLAAPLPETNADTMRAIRESEGIAIGLPATTWMLEIGAFLLRTETELILKSRRVVPTRLLDEGFPFHYPTLPEALAHLKTEN